MFELRKLVWTLPVVAGLAVGLGTVRDRTTTVSASSRIGPLSFPKYGLAASNNAVDESDAVKNWRVRWSFTAGEPLQQASIARGRIYVAGDGGDRHNPIDNRIDALDAATGRLMWSRQLNNMSMTTPVVADGLVFVGTGTQQFHGHNLTLEDNLTSTGVVRGTGPSAIYALQARTGRVVWDKRTRGEDMPTFLVHRGVLYTANGQGRVYALNPRSGARLWSLSIGSYVSMASLAMGSGGILYVSGAHPYTVYGVDTNTHRILFSTHLPHVFGGSDDSSPAYAHGLVYLEGTTGSWRHPDSTLFALDGRTGAIRQATHLGTGNLPTDIEVSAPVIADGRVFVGSPITNREYALAPKTGRILWQFQADGPISESAAVTARTLYVGDGSGFLYALNPATGTEEGSRYIGGTLAADYPLVVGKTLYQPNENGQLLALPRKTLLTADQNRVPKIPIPSGAVGQQIIRGEALFMGRGLAGSGKSCATCHVDGGAITTYQHSMVVPALLGAAATFPKVHGHHVVTLDDQINHCLVSMGGSALSSTDPRLAELNLYLHWLSSGWAMNINASSGLAGGPGGGCR